MEDKTKREDENLNSNNEEIQEPKEKTFSNEEVEVIKKEMAANSEKWVQKLIKEIKILKEAMKELSLILKKEERLIELLDENREVAFLLLDDFFCESLDDYKNRIWYTRDLEDPIKYKKRLENESNKKAESRIIDIEKTKFIKKLKMSEDEKLNFEEIFNDFRKTKNINLDDLELLFEKSYIISNSWLIPHIDTRKQEMIGKLMTVSWWKGNSRISNNNREAKIWAEVKEFLQKNKLI